MKIYTFFTIIFIGFNSLIGTGFNFKLNVNNFYDENILLLSDQDLDSFSKGQNLEKLRLHSTDDWITNIALRLNYKHYLYGHTQQISVTSKYERYWYNPIKNNASFHVRLKQFFSSKLSLELGYSFYPELYVNHYDSVLDFPEYESYDYSKNLYLASGKWKINKKFAVVYQFQFSQLYYNSFFTEYDAENFVNDFEFEFDLNRFFHIDFTYAFTISDAAGKNAYDEIESVEEFKDPSYERNKYSTRYFLPRLTRIAEKRIDFELVFTYSEKYFQSSFQSDSYHYSRDEFQKDVKVSFPVKWNSSLQLEPFFNYRLRSVRSPYSYVIEDKEYSTYQGGLNIGYSF